MDDDEDIYLPETLISEHTCRPLFKSTNTEIPTFWCDLCRAMLKNPVLATQHVNGKEHKSRYTKKQSDSVKSETQTGVKLENTVPKVNMKTVDRWIKKQEPSPKKSKIDTASDKQSKDVQRNVKDSDRTKTKDPSSAKGLQCEACNITFTSEIHAIEHFKGKKHAAKLVEDSIQTTSQHRNKDVQKDTKVPEKTKSKDLSKEKDAILCEACNLSFTSDIHALQHFKGRKHAAIVAEIYNKQNQGQKRGGGVSGGRGRGSPGNVGSGGGAGRGGAGRGGAGRGRGRAIGRGFSNDKINNAGEALYDSYYSQPTNTLNGTGGSTSYYRYYSHGNDGYSNANDIYSNGSTENYSAPTESYSNAMDTLHSRINQLKRKLGSIY